MSKWFQAQRQMWITRTLMTYGQVNRKALCEYFDISPAQASLDIREYIAAHPGKMVYDATTKCYLHEE